MNYLDSPFVIPYYLVFMSSWIYLRHYQNLRFLASMLPLSSPFPAHIDDIWHHYVFVAYTNVRTTLEPIILRPLTVVFPQTASMAATASAFLVNWYNTPSEFESVGPFELNWDTQQYKCTLSQWITFGLMAALQAVNLFWLFFIVRILYRAVTSLGLEARDERSEYDTEEERDIDDIQEKPVFVDKGKSAAETRARGNGSAVKH
jgi:4-amino-4-deoxy-L-arabinose transferase-like glycosyltransferase